MNNRKWQLYILRCSDNSLYTGITMNLERRLFQHRNGKGAKYINGRLPILLVFSNEVKNQRFALQLERKIKRFSKLKKEDLVKNPCKYTTLFNDII